VDKFVKDSLFLFILNSYWKLFLDFLANIFCKLWCRNDEVLHSRFLNKCIAQELLTIVDKC
jgi:hypothetical protein